MSAHVYTDTVTDRIKKSKRSKIGNPSKFLHLSTKSPHHNIADGDDAHLEHNGDGTRTPSKEYVG